MVWPEEGWLEDCRRGIPGIGPVALDELASPSNPTSSIYVGGVSQPFREDEAVDVGNSLTGDAIGEVGVAYGMLRGTDGVFGRLWEKRFGRGDELEISKRGWEKVQRQ